MRDLIILLVHLITTVFRLARPGGLRSVVAESVLIKHQLLIVNRSRRRAPNLRVLDRLIAGCCSLWIKPTRLRRAAIALKPSTVLHFHRALVQRKYRLLFSPKRRVKPGPKGPNSDVIRAVVDMKQRNPTRGCPRIPEQITWYEQLNEVRRATIPLSPSVMQEGMTPDWSTGRLLQASNHRELDGPLQTDRHFAKSRRSIYLPGPNSFSRA